MGTKIQANAFFREYHSVIDLDGSTSNGMRYSGPFKSYGSEKVRQTILEHESVFRHQVQIKVGLHSCVYAESRQISMDCVITSRTFCIV